MNLVPLQTLLTHRCQIFVFAVFEALLLLTKTKTFGWNKIKYNYYMKSLNLKNLNENEKCCLGS